MPPKRVPVQVPRKTNPSVAYEVLVYLNSFYFGMFACCELSMGLLKAINLTYTGSSLARDSSVLIILCILETIRIIMGGKGPLSDRGKFTIERKYIIFRFEFQKLTIFLFLCRLASYNVGNTYCTLLPWRLVCTDTANL